MEYFYEGIPQHASWQRSGVSVTTGLKVLLVLTPALHPNEGGVQMSTCKLGRYFGSIGHQVVVFSFAHKGHAAPSYLELNSASEGGGIANSANQRQLSELLASFQPDVVINQMPYEHSIGETLSRGKSYLLLGCLRNTLYSVKGDIDAFLRKVVPGRLRPVFNNPVGKSLLLAHHRRRHRADLEKILATYDYFVMFGPPNIEELRYFVPDFNEDRIHLIPNSIPEVAVQVPSKEKRLLWLGRVAESQKRADLIPDIWRRVSTELPDWELDVVGEGPELAGLKVRMESLGLERFHFHGRQVPDDYYRRTAIFFMTSAFEGFPNTLVEAQSHGAIPVVFDSYPVASWIVDDRKSGFLVKPFDLDMMAKRIIELANNPDRIRLAEGALQSARRFHIDRVGEMWQALFEAEVSKHVGKPDGEEVGKSR